MILGKTPWLRRGYGSWSCKTDKFNFCYYEMREWFFDYDGAERVRFVAYDRPGAERLSCRILREKEDGVWYDELYVRDDESGIWFLTFMETDTVKACRRLLKGYKYGKTFYVECEYE